MKNVYLFHALSPNSYISPISRMIYESGIVETTPGEYARGEATRAEYPEYWK